jgi:hypothetical protein
MKKLFGIILIILSLAVYAQDETTGDNSTPPDNQVEAEKDANMPETVKSDEKTVGSVIIGGVTIDGKNYQQMGMRFDIPIGKLGIGVDIQLLIDEKGKIREEDWDEFEDYLDKVYYLRWARKGDPFYIKVGGLDYTYLGYNILVDGYSNMIEYPAYKRIGMEMSFEGEKFGGELLINNYKELIADEPGLLLGLRGFYKVWGDLAVGATFASDFNEYNGLRDNDGDGFPNEIDRFPEDDKYATWYDYYLIRSNPGVSDPALMDSSYAEQSVGFGLIDGIQSKDLENFNGRTKSSIAYGFDIGYPLYKGDFARIDIYAQWAQIKDYGSGFSAPGFRIKAGPFIFNAEYRRTDGEFLFGYFNQAYELERAVYVAGLNTYVTKQQMLEFVPALDGYFVGMHFDGWGIFRLNVNYQDLISEDDVSCKSLSGEVALDENLIKKLAAAKVYYMQSNIEKIEWRTPSTILGYVLGYNVNESTAIMFDYRYTFKDKNGDMDVKDKDEMIKTISIATKITF